MVKKRIKKTMVSLAVMSTVLSLPSTIFSHLVSADEMTQSTFFEQENKQNTVVLKTDVGSMTLTTPDADINANNVLSVTFGFPDGKSSYDDGYVQETTFTIKNGKFIQTDQGKVINNGSQVRNVNYVDPTDYSIMYTADSVDTPVVITAHFEAAVTNEKDIRNPIEVVKEVELSVNVTNPVFEQAKNDAKDKIDAMRNLSATEKDTFNNQIDQAKTPADVEEIILEAQEQDAKDLDNFKRNSQTEIDALPNLTQESKDKYKETIENAGNRDGIQQAVDEAKKEDTLLSGKKEASAEINSLSHLTDAEKKGYTDQLNQAINQAELDGIVADAKSQDLANAKDQAKNQIDQLGNLTDEEKSKYKNQIDGASSSEQIPLILEEANEKNQSHLTEAKEIAKNKIDDLPNLSNGVKDEYKKKIDTTKDPSEIDQIVAEATKEDKLTAQKETAKDAIDSLINLSSVEKEQFKSAIDVAQEANAIQPIVDDATAQDQANLEKAKTDGKANIFKLPDLTDQAKQDYADQIDMATTITTIDDILTKAQEANDLAEKKEESIQLINQLPDLSQEEKEEYIDKVNAAATPEEVEDIVRQAQAQDKNDLESAKEEAVGTIEALPNLDDPTKKGYQDKIETSPTVKDIQTIVNQATTQDALIQAKKKGDDAIDGLGALTKEQINDYKNRIANQVTPTGIQSVVDEAVEQNEANQAAADLLASKEDAKKKINELKNLSPEEKNQLNQQVDNAKTPIGVANALNKAYGTDADHLAADQDTAKKQIDGLSNLDDTAKNNYKDAIDNAQESDSINQIIAEAQAKNDALNVLPGDLNNNGEITLADLSILASYRMAPETFDFNNLGLTEKQFMKAADLNNDGKIGVADANILSNMIFSNSN